MHYPFKWIQLIEWIWTIPIPVQIPNQFQLFEYEQLSALTKLIKKMRQIFVNAPLKSLLHIYYGAYF